MTRPCLVASSRVPLLRAHAASLSPDQSASGLVKDFSSVNSTHFFSRHQNVTISPASRNRPLSANFSLSTHVPSTSSHQSSINSVFFLHFSSPSVSATSCVAVSDLNRYSTSLTSIGSVASLAGLKDDVCFCVVSLSIDGALLSPVLFFSKLRELTLFLSSCPSCRMSCLLIFVLHILALSRSLHHFSHLT